ncbi:hypothetical protein EB118_24020 [bacterium]|nr:hypothetical protein [bacterium]
MKLIDYTLFTDKLNHSTLWINYINDEEENIDREIPFSKIIELLYDAREIVDYDKEDFQFVILPDNKHIETPLYSTLRSKKVLLNTTRFWNSYKYTDKAVYLYLETLKK